MIFHFKQFDIAQDRCAMKVGTDGVLLGAWVELEIKHPKRTTGCIEVQDSSSDCRDVHNTLQILDIGTGTGLIALMVAQRCKVMDVDFDIDAIEIDANAACQAADNVLASPWASQIKVHGSSLADYMTQLPSDQKYDLIVSNPPFYNATLKPDDEARAVARHKDSLPLDEIMQCALHTLSPYGRLALIYPTNYDSEVMTQAIAAGLKPVRICNVLTKAGKICKRRMTEFCLNNNETTGTVYEVNTLSIRDAEGNYTTEYMELTLPFYTHLH